MTDSPYFLYGPPLGTAYAPAPPPVRPNGSTLTFRFAGPLTYREMCTLIAGFGTNALGFMSPGGRGMHPFTWTCDPMPAREVAPCPA